MGIWDYGGLDGESIAYRSVTQVSVTVAVTVMGRVGVEILIQYRVCISIKTTRLGILNF